MIAVNACSTNIVYMFYVGCLYSFFIELYTIVKIIPDMIPFVYKLNGKWHKNIK